MPPKSNLPQSSTNYTGNQYQLRRHPVPTTPKRQLRASELVPVLALSVQASAY